MTEKIEQFWLSFGKMNFFPQAQGAEHRKCLIFFRFFF